MTSIRIISVCLLLVGIVVSPLVGDDDQAIAAFGKGVHAFFEKQYDAADEWLSESIAAQSNDPRPYYFRGLIRNLAGDLKSGEADFRKGAEIELTPFGRSYDVGDALERVQGPTRLEIEKFRRDAIAHVKAQMAQPKVPRAQGNRADRSTPDKAFDPGNLPDVSQIVDSTIPFPEISAKPYYPPAKLATNDETVDPDLPSATVEVTPSAAKTAPADDPFSSGNQKPAGDEAMAEKADEGQDPAPAADDPFGSGKADEGAAKEDASEPPKQESESDSGNKNPEPAEDDPFGGG